MLAPLTAPATRPVRQPCPCRLGPRAHASRLPVVLQLPRGLGRPAADELLSPAPGLTRRQLSPTRAGVETRGTPDQLIDSPRTPAALMTQRGGRPGIRLSFWTRCRSSRESRTACETGLIGQVR